MFELRSSFSKTCYVCSYASQPPNSSISTTSIVEAAERQEGYGVTARSRQTFEQLITLPDLGIPLAEAALLMACEEYPQLSLRPYLDQLDRMADSVRATLGDDAEPRETIEGINHVLFVDYGFRGNTSDYYDPRNSFLNDVIDRRIGIPITLSAIYLEVARRLEFPVEGVGMPGHFVVKYRSGDEEIFLDPFNAGSMLTRQQCRDFICQMKLEDGQNTELWLRRVTNRQILARMLNNVKVIYLKAEAFDKALMMADLLVLIEPAAEELYRDRGLLRLQVRQFEGAMRDLQRYLNNRPEADDRDDIDMYLKDLHRIHAMMN